MEWEKIVSSDATDSDSTSKIYKKKKNPFTAQQQKQTTTHLKNGQEN